MQLKIIIKIVYSLSHYQGVMVVVANSHVHFDPKYWTNPDDFDPMRFITAEGKFQAPKEGFMAFGSGEQYLRIENTGVHY